MKTKTTVVIFIFIILWIIAVTIFIAIRNNKGTATTIINNYTTGKTDIKLTVGVLKADKTSFKVFGASNKQLEPTEYQYEIGSISKTFTASLLCKAINDGKVNLDDAISKYLPLNANGNYPTIKSLATHTSGYGEYPFDAATLSAKELETINDNFYKKRLNIYQGINKDILIDKINSYQLNDKPYDWEYSNFGIAALGAVLANSYSTTYKQLAESFITNELVLTKTRFGNGNGDLNNYWGWGNDDTYLASAGLVSTVSDLLKYSELQLKANPNYLGLSHNKYQTFSKDGFSIGLGWIIDNETGCIWHNGGTSSYTSFIGFNKQNNTAVVILSNYAAPDGDKDDDALDTLGFTLLNNLSGDGVNVDNVV